MVAGEKNSIFQ